MPEKTLSISSARPADEIKIWTPSERPADSVARTAPETAGFAASQSTAIRPAFGTTSLSSSRRLALNSAESVVSPVTFPPGCARLATRPVPTGSAVFVITIGDRLRCALRRENGRRTRGHNDVDSKAHKLIGAGRK